MPRILRASLRELGHVYFGEAFVVVRDSRDLVHRLDDAKQQCIGLDWRLHDFVIMPVDFLPEEGQPARQAGEGGEPARPD